MFPELSGAGPALYDPRVIANVSFSGRVPPSTTVTLKVHEPPQLPVNVAVFPATSSDVIRTLKIATWLAGSE